MKRVILVIGAALLGAALLRVYVIEGIYIASASMEPAYPLGTHLFLNKTAYRFGKPKRRDVIVFESPVDKGKDLVKRVVAVEGETVEIRKKKVYINGTMLEEPYVKHWRGDVPLVGDNLGPVTVLQDAVFVLGDNRDFSGDSRDRKDAQSGQWIPFVPLSLIKGRIISLTG